MVISPVAFEPTGDRLLPDGQAENERLRLYAGPRPRWRRRRGSPSWTCSEKSSELMTADPGMQLTINGCPPERTR